MKNPSEGQPEEISKNPEEGIPANIPEPEQFHESTPDREGIRNKLRELGIPVREDPEESKE